MAENENLLPTVFDKLNSRISQIGMGPYQYKLFGLCALGWAADNMWFQSLAVTLPSLQLEYNLQGYMIGICTFSTHIGAMMGAGFWGFVGDWFGRQPVFLWTLTLTMIGGFMASISTSLLMVCFSFLLLGFGVGGNLPIDGALFLEFVPYENQSLLTLLSLFWPIGQIVTSLVGWLLIPGHICNETVQCLPEDNRGWRFTIFTLSMLTLLMVLLRVFVFSFLESPKNLIARGKYSEAAAVVRQLAEINEYEVEISDDEFVPDGYESYSHEQNNDFGCLLDKEVLFSFILILIIWTFMSVGYTIFNAFLPTYLKNVDVGDISSSEVWRNYFIIATLGVPGSIAAMHSSDSILGRKGTMSICAFGMAISLFLFTIVKSSTGQLLASCLISFLQNALYGVLYAYSPEVFPTHIRGKAVGLASASSRLFGSLSPLLTGYLFSFSLQLPLYIASGLIFICSILIALLPIETRGVAAK